MKNYKSAEFVNFWNVKPARKNVKALLQLSSDDSESAAYSTFVHKKPNLTQMKQEFHLTHKMTRYYKNLEIPWPSWLHVCTRGMYNQGFLRCFRDQIGVPRIENRVPRISQNYHQVPRIRENWVSRIREIGSLHVHTGYLTFSLKKTDITCMQCNKYFM